jgi:AraC-like DNA-binding protein
MRDDYFSLALGSEPDSKDIWRHGSASALQMKCEFGRGDPAGSDVAAWTLGRIDILSGRFTQLSMRPLADVGDPWLCLKLVTGGSMYIEQAGQRRHVGPGEIVMVESAQPYCQAFDGPTEFIGLRFPAHVLKERGLRHDLHGLVAPDTSSADVRAIVGMVVALAAQRGGTSETLRCRQGEQLLDVIDLLIDDPSSLMLARSGRATVHRAKRYIEKNLRNPGLTTSTVAAAVCVSDSHLSRLFRASGQSLTGFLWESRLALASDMLRRSDGLVRIGEIAYRCGFANHAHFSRVFKKHYGMTPSEVSGTDGREITQCFG